MNLETLRKRTDPSKWVVASNNGVTIVASNLDIGEVYNGPVAGYNAIFKAVLPKTGSIETDFDALGNVAAIVGADGIAYGTEGYAPVGLTQSSTYSTLIGAANWSILNALATLVSSKGGGIINMPSGNYPISTALVPRSGVRYKGVAPRFVYNINTAVPDPYLLPTGGTCLIGDAAIDANTGVVTNVGTFDGYAGNTSVLGSQASTFANDGFTEAGVIDITFAQFRSGINVGATNNPGFWYSTFKVHVISCTDFGIKMENMQNLLGTYMHTSGCVHGQRYRNASAGLNCGNLNFTHIYHQPRRFHSTFDRGILFENTVGFEFNELVIDRVQANGNGARANTTLQSVSNIAAFDGTTTKTVNVSDGTKFEIGLPVYFYFQNTQTYSSYQYGINQGKIFWVSNVTGNSIRVSQSYRESLAGTNEQIFSTGTAANLQVGSNGYAGLEFNELTGTGALVNFQVLQIDIECNSTVAVQAQGLTKSELHTNNLPSSLAVSNGNRIHIAGRGCTNMTVFANSPANSDFDNSFWKWYGSRINPGDANEGIGNSPAGLWNNNLAVSNKSNNFKGDFFRNGAKYQLEQLTPIQLFSTNYGNTTNNFNFGNAGVCNYTQAGVAGTFNLPAVTALDAGTEFDVINSSGATLTVNTAASQLINNKAALVSLSLLANSTARLVATVSSGTFGWALMGVGGSYSAGVVTGV